MPSEEEFDEVKLVDSALVLLNSVILCRVKLRLRLLATGTFPVFGQVFEGDTVVLCGVIDVTTDGADILAGCLLLGEIDFGQNGRHRIIQVHHALGLKIFIALWCMGATIDGGVVASELCITTTYLSRVVRQVSDGRTVVDYINQMLLMEATFLLRQTSLSITQISDQLHFAEVTTFARFFNRMKGMAPREFRKGK